MAKTYLEVPTPTRIVSLGGPVTKNRYLGDNATTWAVGQLVKLASGLIAVAFANGSSPGTVDTDDIAAATLAFLALEAVGTATADYVDVQQLTSDTIFEGVLMSSDAGGTAPATAPASIIGNTYALYQLANGQWGVDKANTTKALVRITDVESNWCPVKDPRADLDALGEQYARVRFVFTGIRDA